MGLIHTRARKQRDRAEAELAKEEARQLRDARTADQLWYRQPTLGGAIAARRLARRTDGKQVSKP